MVNQHGQSSWQDATKIFDPVSNRVIQSEFIQTMIAEHPLFANYYDPANVKIDGGTAEFVGGQMSQGSPKRWKRGFSRADWPHSDNLKQRLYLVEYGLFGDMTSHDFGRLAFQNPGMLAQVFDSKIEVVIQQWKRAVEDHILYNLLDRNNYSDGSFEELPKDFFKVETDPSKTLACQAKALNFIAKVESRAYKFLEYTDKYNLRGKDGVEAVSPSLKFLTLILDPSANTFLNIYGYSSAFNVGYLDLKQKLGKVIVKRLGSYIGKADSLTNKEYMYKQYNSDGTQDEHAGVIVKGRHDYNWKALLHDTNFYKIHEAINHPGNEDVFINSEDYSIDLTSYVGKWWFCFEGIIKYVNASAWVQTGLDAEEIKAAKPTQEEKKKVKEERKTNKKTLATELKTFIDNLKTTPLWGEMTHGEKNRLNEADTKKKAEAVRDDAFSRLYPIRLARMIADAEAHFKTKSDNKKLTGKIKNKSLDDILGADWKKADTYPIKTVYNATSFKSELKKLTDKIDAAVSA
jgi:hypothetical protein